MNDNPNTPAAPASLGDLDVDGFARHPAVIAPGDLAVLQAEADRLSADAGTACVRHIRSRSRLFAELASDNNRLTRLLPPGFRPVRSILFDKTPAENWPVAWHQDTTIAVYAQMDVPGYGPWSSKDGVVHVQPPVELLETMVTLRLHLDDTPADNGALRVIPGSHLHGRLTAEEILDCRTRDEIVCACAPGDVLRMRPLILHASSRALHPARRRVLHFEYAPADALDPRLRWAESTLG